MGRFYLDVAVKLTLPMGDTTLQLISKKKFVKPTLERENPFKNTFMVGYRMLLQC